MTWQTDWVRKLHSFKNAKKILEVGAGSFQTAKILAKHYPKKYFYGIDFVLSDKALSTLKDIPENLTIIKNDARDLQLLNDNFFDLSYSIAVMEHIHELELHLIEMHRIIKPSGSYCFWEAPFWSCSCGHHYKPGNKICPIPPYGHLYMNRDELHKHILTTGQSESSTSYIVSRVFDRGDLSRLTHTQTKKIIESSNFAIEFWDQEEDENYTPSLAKKVIKKNIYNIAMEDLKIKGVRACLAKNNA